MTVGVRIKQFGGSECTFRVAYALVKIARFSSYPASVIRALSSAALARPHVAVDYLLIHRPTHGRPDRYKIFIGQGDNLGSDTALTCKGSMTLKASWGANGHADRR